MQQLIDEENKAPEVEADGKVVAAFRFRGRGQGRELFVKGVTLSEVWRGVFNKGREVVHGP
jgi:hypothetical protein